MAEYMPWIENHEDDDDEEDKNKHRDKKRPRIILPKPPVEERPATELFERPPPSKEVEEHERRLESRAEENPDKDESEEKPNRLQDEQKAEVVAEKAAEPVEAEDLRVIAQERREAQTEPDPSLDKYFDHVEEGIEPEEAADQVVQADPELVAAEAQARDYLLDPEVQAILDQIDQQLAEQGIQGNELPEDQWEELAQEVLEQEPEGTQEAAHTEPEYSEQGFGATYNYNAPTLNQPPTIASAPPVPPTMPTGVQSPAPMPGIAPPGVPPSPGGWGGGGPGGSKNTLGAPNLQPGLSSAERRAVRRKVMGTALLAGLIGYYFGRKHGRRKQEAEMRPVQESLAKENKQLRSQVLIGEKRIKSLRRIQAEQAAIGEATVRQQQIAPEQHTPAEPALEETTAEVMEAKPEPITVEAPATTITPEAEQPTRLQPVERPKEYIAPVVAAERAMPSNPEPSSEMALPKTTAPETLSEPAILELAGNIRFEGVNAKQLYEQNRLDKESLRKVVTEYVKGGQPERVLANELGAAEIRRAASPEFLDKTATGSAAVAGGGSAASPANVPADHMLPAYDDPEYPSDTPEHLLPAETEQLHHEKSGLGLALAFGALLLLAVILAFLLL